MKVAYQRLTGSFGKVTVRQRPTSNNGRVFADNRASTVNRKFGPKSEAAIKAERLKGCKPLRLTIFPATARIQPGAGVAIARIQDMARVQIEQITCKLLILRELCHRA